MALTKYNPEELYDLTDYLRHAENKEKALDRIFQ